MARKKAKRYDDGGEIVVSGSRAADALALDRMMREPSFVNSSLGSRFGGDDSGGGGGGGGSSSPKVSVGKVRTPVGKVFGVRDIPVGKGSLSVGVSPMGGGKVGGTFRTSFKKGGKLPDLTGDGKVTRADVLKGRGVPGFKKGSKVSAAEAVHKHERAKHKGQPLTKMAKGGSAASKRGDGCATKGKTKGRFV